MDVQHEPLIDDDGVEHRPTDSTYWTGDGGEARGCVGCGYRWPCPFARMQPEPLLPGGDVVLDLVDVGWSIYRRRPAGSDAVSGGLVIDVVHVSENPDDPPSYRVLDWRAGRPWFETLHVGEFDPLLSNPPNSAVIRSQARKLCELVARSKGAITLDDVEHVLAAASLLKAIA